MSRQFNPAIAAYNNLKIDMSPKSEPKPSMGLLSPKKKPTDNQDEDMSQPMFRVKKHVEAIRRKRMEEQDV